MSTVALTPLKDDDVRSLARLHRAAFPGFFLSDLGEPFLAQFYRGFLADSQAVTVVARDAENGVLGAAVGTTEPVRFFARLLRKRWPAFAIASAVAAFRRPAAAPRLLRAVRYRGDSPAGAGAEGALLSSIFVEPSAQGSGLGARLVEEWTRRVAARGVQTAFLTTDAYGNDAVNRFYRSLGWVHSDTYTTPEGRQMNRYTICLGGK